MVVVVAAPLPFDEKRSPRFRPTARRSDRAFPISTARMSSTGRGSSPTARRPGARRRRRHGETHLDLMRSADLAPQNTPTLAVHRSRVSTSSPHRRRTPFLRCPVTHHRAYRDPPAASSSRRPGRSRPPVTARTCESRRDRLAPLRFRPFRKGTRARRTRARASTAIVARRGVCPKTRPEAKSCGDYQKARMLRNVRQENAVPTAPLRRRTTTLGGAGYRHQLGPDCLAGRAASAEL